VAGLKINPSSLVAMFFLSLIVAFFTIKLYTGLEIVLLFLLYFL
jgi:hypothetical protein